MDFGDLFKQIEEMRSKAEAHANGHEVEIELQNGNPKQLLEAAAVYLRPRDYGEGDLVVWKPGMKNARWPTYGMPIAVIKFEPGRTLDDEEHTGGQLEHCPRDLWAAMFDKDGDFSCWWFDAQRFERWKGEL